MIKKNSTRDRLISATIRSLQRKGYAGVGVSSILLEAKAPKGVLYHHFPEGKTGLVVEAVRASIAQIVEELQVLRKKYKDPLDGLQAWLNAACHRLEKSGYEAGCPLAAASLESTPEDAELHKALAESFSELRSELAMFIASSGIPEQRSLELSLLLVSSYEGALIQARVASDRTIFERIGTLVIGMLREEQAKSTKGALL